MKMRVTDNVKRYEYDIRNNVLQRKIDGFTVNLHLEQGDMSSHKMWIPVGSLSYGKTKEPKFFEITTFSAIAFENLLYEMCKKNDEVLDSSTSIGTLLNQAKNYKTLSKKASDIAKCLNSMITDKQEMDVWSDGKGKITANDVKKHIFWSINCGNYGTELLQFDNDWNAVKYVVDEIIEDVEWHITQREKKEESE